MGKLKKCQQCGKNKSIDEFSKRAASKDGLQPKCKSCNKVQNDTYRLEHEDYWDYKTGYFSDKKKWEYISEYMKADKSIKVYKINLPSGKVYIGSTKALLNVRMTRHVSDWFMWKKGLRKKYIPNLYDEFDKLGDKDKVAEWLRDNTFVLEETIGQRTRQHKREQWWMDRYTKDGVILANSARAYGQKKRTNTYKKKKV